MILFGDSSVTVRCQKAVGFHTHTCTHLNYINPSHILWMFFSIHSVLVLLDASLPMPLLKNSFFLPLKSPLVKKGFGLRKGVTGREQTQKSW